MIFSQKKMIFNALKKGVFGNTNALNSEKLGGPSKEKGWGFRYPVLR